MAQNHDINESNLEQVLYYDEPELAGEIPPILKNYTLCGENEWEIPKSNDNKRNKTRIGRDKIMTTINNKFKCTEPYMKPKHIWTRKTMILYWRTTINALD